MRRKILAPIVVVCLLCGTLFYAASGRNYHYAVDYDALVTAPKSSAERRMVDMTADDSYLIEQGDSTVFILVGNFAAHHNGTVILADSAIRYPNQSFECFGNVLINQNETYAYGERAHYDRANSTATIYSELVKVVDGDVTLYTYKFKFNTLESIGIFSDGGVVTKGDNILESDRGYFYANQDQIICVDKVQMTNNEYQMMGDSVIYHIDTDRAQFFTHTNIWNDKGEYLYADRGSYEKDGEVYVITKNGYILTENEEVWSDSLDYYRDRGYGLLRHNVQLDDQKHKMVAFGDRGEYWKEQGNAMLTLDPSAISYDLEQGDSVFMRADTMMLYSRSTQGDKEEAERKRLEEQRAFEEARLADSVKRAEEAQKSAEAAKSEEKSENETGDDESKSERRGRDKKDKDEKRKDMTPDEGKTVRKLDKAESRLPSAEISEQVSEMAGAEGAEGVDSVQMPKDSLATDVTLADSLKLDSLQLDSLQLDSLAADSIKVMSAADSLAARLDTLPKAERKALLKEIALKEREAKRAEQTRIKDSIKREKLKIQKAKLDSIGELRQQKRNQMLDKLQAREDSMRARMKAREEARKLKMIARLTRKGVVFQWADSVARMRADSTLYADGVLYDSLAEGVFESMIVRSLDTLLTNVMAVDTAVVDTQYRLMLGYRNVRIFRKDFQAICDSLSSSSLDSVIRMYINPVLWQEQNQVTSEVVNMQTSNQQVVRAEFTGKPMMISKIDTLHYNQIAGKTMTSHFRNNAIYRNDVDGNAQTIYYMQEEGSPEVQGLMYIESANMSFFIEEQMVTGITYRGSPTYTIYPMDKIPETQSLFLQDFAWHADKRPTQDSVFTRTLRPSLRVEKEALPRPKFPIAKRIGDYRVRLVERKEWRDRNDILTQEVVDWLEMNTDWRAQTEENRRQREEFGR